MDGVKLALEKRESPRTSGEWVDPFLAALRGSGNVRWSCEQAGITRTTAYDRRELDESFRARWDEAMADAVDFLEGVAWKRAREQSDLLLIFLLKAHRRSLYGDVVRNEHSGPDGKPIPTQEVPYDLSALSVEELDILDRLHAKAQRHPAGAGPAPAA